MSDKDAEKQGTILIEDCDELVFTDSVLSGLDGVVVIRRVKHVILKGHHLNREDTG